jgi:preprotein translocase subunit SecB
MQNSPLQLEDYMVKRLRFALTSPLNEMFDPQTAYDSLDIEVTTQTNNRNNDPLCWRSEISIRSKDEKEGIYPYTFELVYVGFFRVHQGFPNERIEQMVRANAPALLYSAARETLMYLTGRGRLPPIMLPSLTFIEPPKQHQNKQSAKPSVSRARKSAGKKK